MNILHALDDPKVFGPFFKGDTWAAWRVFLAALFALPMTAEQACDLPAAHWSQRSHRAQPSHEGLADMWTQSRQELRPRSGRVSSSPASATGGRILGPGERATVMVIAADRKQARTILRYCTGLLRETPMLARADRGRDAGEHQPAQPRHHRGSRRIVSLDAGLHASLLRLLDELAFWPTDESSAEPDIEIINAVRPGMATIPGRMLLCASRPTRARASCGMRIAGTSARTAIRCWCWHAATRAMNPRVPQRVIDAAMARDPAHASAEFLATFRTDIENFIKLSDG